MYEKAQKSKMHSLPLEARNNGIGNLQTLYFSWLPFRMKIYTSFKLTAWLRLVEFMGLIVGEFRLWKILHSYKASTL